MTRTVGEVLVAAYATVNDVDRDRHTEAEARGFVVDALNFVKNTRPDLFLGKYTQPIGPYVNTDVLPIDDQFLRPIADYVIARMETKDDEAVVAARVELMAKFAVGWMT